MTQVADPKQKRAKDKALDSVEIFGDDSVLDLTAEVGTQEPEISGQPGDPDFDWAEQYPGEKFYVYTAKSGVTVGLAAMSEERKPTMGELEEILQKDQLRQMFETVARIASPEALRIAKGFKESDYTKMLDEWSAWSNTTLGES